MSTTGGSSRTPGGACRSSDPQAGLTSLFNSSTADRAHVLAWRDQTRPSGTALGRLVRSHALPQNSAFSWVLRSLRSGGWVIPSELPARFLRLCLTGLSQTLLLLRPSATTPSPLHAKQELPSQTPFSCSGLTDGGLSLSPLTSSPSASPINSASKEILNHPGLDLPPPASLQLQQPPEWSFKT